MDKLVGTALLFWPCCWSVALAAAPGSLPDLLLVSKFALGAFVMRGAGCTINDMWDRDFDRHVERTRTRPLASGQITMPQAAAFLGLQLSCGLGVLLSLHPSCISLGLLSMPLVVAYPLMKRVSNWPQLVLGLTFNWGALVGWTAVHGSLSLPHTLPLYAAGVCWTLVYDTLYGYQGTHISSHRRARLFWNLLTTPPTHPIPPTQKHTFTSPTDRKDDQKLGLKSTSLTLGDHPQQALTAIAAGMTGSLLVTGAASGLTWPYYLGVSAVSGHVLWQIWTADVDNAANLWARFNSNKYTGAVVTAAIVAGHF